MEEGDLLLQFLDDGGDFDKVELEFFESGKVCCKLQCGDTERG